MRKQGSKRRVYTLETLDDHHSAAEVRQSVFMYLNRSIIMSVFIRRLTIWRLICFTGAKPLNSLYREG
jgi:hypothetical protein